MDMELVPEIGKYHLIAELARGGMGIVHLAAAQGPGGFNKLLVVKELRPEFSEDQNYVTMFLDEARLAAKLTHRNIVQTIEVGSDGSRHYMVMEFLDGRSLYRIARRFADRGGFPVVAHLRIIAESLLGLHYAHDLKGFDGESLGIVHRDVSPLNVLVTFDGQVKVLDFGIAKSVESTLETKAGILKGRVAYMAPEQACGQPVDRRADVYSAGVMIWEAIAGHRLWRGKNDVEILAQILREGAPPLSSVRPDVPRELDVICQRAMAREPGDRYPSAAALLEDLEAYLATRPDAMTMRDVGGLISAVFAEERRRMNAIIEETLTRVRGSAPRSGVVPTVDGQMRRTPSGRIPMLGELGDSQLLSLNSKSILASSGSIVGSVPAADPNLGGPALAELADLERPAWWKTRRAAMAAGAAGALALAVLGVIPLVSAPPPPRASVTPAAAGAAPRFAVTSPPESIDLTIRVSPPAAQITLDGAQLSSNPFRGRYPRDGLAHHLSATAEGYEPKLEDIPFANDVSIEISLDKKAPPAVHWVQSPPAVVHPVRRTTPTISSSMPAAEIASPPPPSPAPPAAAPAPAARAAEVGPASGRAPLRPIMTSNPYGSP